MQKKSMSLFGGSLCAAVACAFLVLLWSAPVLLAGRLWNVLPHLLARNVAATGLFSATDELGRILATPLLAEFGVPSAADGRLSMLYMAWLSQWIPWEASVLWAIAGAATFAMGLWFFWQAVACKLDNRTAWLTLVIAALLPVYWREAVWFDNYNLSFFFLFAAMAAYCCIKKRWLGIIIAGLCFGLSVSAKDVFLVFVPWLALTFAWKKQWSKGAVFFVLAGAMYLLPYLGDIQQFGYPINQNLARVWPGAQEIANETYLHLYPDPYTYHFNKEGFDENFLEQAMQKSFADRMADEKVILSYGLEHSVLRRVRLGFWLLLKDVLSLLQRQTVGGVFMWLFVLPGIFTLYKRDRTLLLWLLGLVVTMYVGIRFVLLYERQHLMNVAWMLALFAGLGVMEVATWTTQHVPRLTLRKALVLLLAVVSLQLVQANRYEFARLYRESTMEKVAPVANALRQLPEAAVVAVGTDSTSAYKISLLSNRTIVLIRDTTVEKLIERGELSSVLKTYGVTHAIGYEKPLRGVRNVDQLHNSITMPSKTLWLLNVIR